MQYWIPYSDFNDKCSILYAYKSELRKTSQIGGYTKVADIITIVNITNEYYSKSQYTINNEPYDEATKKTNVKVGDEFITEAVYKNKYGNYWLKVHNESGTVSGYICANEVKLDTQAAKPSVSGLVYPTGNLNKGSGFDLKGTVSAPVVMPKVYATVTNQSDGTNALPEASVTNVKSLSLLNSKINVASQGGLKFGSLEKGNYYFTLAAEYYTYTNVSKSSDNPLTRSTVYLIKNAPFTVDGGTGSVTPTEIKVNSIALNNTTKSIKNGETFTLTATLSPANATNKAVTWTSSNTAVATVSTAGVVTAKSVGQATITCTSADGSNVKQSCTVTVTSANAGTLTISDIIYPSPYNYNSTVGFVWKSGSGTVKSNVNVTKITFNIYGNGQLIDSSTATPNTPSFEISSFTGSIKVSKIKSAGLYLFEIIAEDAEGKVLKAGVYFNAKSSGATHSTDSAVAKFSKTYGATPTKVKSSTYKGSTYTLYTGDLQWEEAVAYAKSVGGHLAVITDSAENAAVHSLISGTSAKAVWIGGCRPSGSDWQWANGEPMTYINWNTSAPDNTTGRENAMNMYVSDGTWNDSTFDAIEYRYFVVEVDSKATGVTIDRGDSSATIHLGEMIDYQPIITITPEYAKYASVQYASSNTNVLKVDAAGKLTGVSSGTANLTVTVTNYDGTTVNATMPITVAPDVQSAFLNIDSTLLYPGQTIQLSPSVFPADACIKSHKYTSSNTNVVTVDDNGIIKAVGVGTTMVTWTVDNWMSPSVSYTATITVAPNAASVTVGDDQIQVLQGIDAQMVAMIYPEDAMYQSIEWKSLDTSVATIDSDGNITAVSQTTKAADMTVTVTNFDGSAVRETFRVKVRANIMPQYTSLSPDNAMVYIGETVQLSPVITNLEPMYDYLEYTSSDEAVAIVDEAGLVTAIAPGSCTIAATFVNFDGSTVQCTSTIRVENYTVLTLPASLSVIEDSAFEGIATQEVIIPAGCIQIGNYAFRNCSNLIKIHIPASVTNISWNAFSGCTNMTIYAPAGSTAADFAKAMGINLIEE